MSPVKNTAFAIVVESPRSLQGAAYADDAFLRSPPGGILVIGLGGESLKRCYFDSATGALIPESSLYLGETPVLTTFTQLQRVRIEPTIFATYAGAKRR